MELKDYPSKQCFVRLLHYALKPTGHQGSSRLESKLQVLFYSCIYNCKKLHVNLVHL